MVQHVGVDSVRMVVHDFMPDGKNQHSVFEEAFALIGIHLPLSPLPSLSPSQLLIYLAFLFMFR
jgi:hypothetical protein